MAVIDNLVAYWDLSESSGTRVDAHDDNDLADGSSVGSGTGPDSGTCIDFEASSFDWVDIADNADLSSGDTNFTINFWLNFETAGTFKFVATKGYGYTTNYEWALITNGSSKLEFNVNVGAADSVAVATSGAAVSTDTWYMVTVWHDATNNQIGISINADAGDTAARTTGVNDGNKPFELGRAEGAGLYFDGRMAYVGFWRRVLTSGDRTFLYNSGSGRNYAAVVAEAGGATLIGLIGGGVGTGIIGS